jgi:hypothetical protein
MSGGQWNYFDQSFMFNLEDFCKDIKKRFPELSKELKKQGKTLCGIIHDIDWDVSGDTEIKDDAKFEATSIKKLNKTTAK